MNALSPNSCRLRREAWAPGVEKLRAVHADRGDLGTVYLDLYSRQGKYNGNAHFTIQCGRLQRDGSYRLPIVALACTFPRSRDEGITFSQARCCAPSLVTL